MFAESLLEFLSATAGERDMLRQVLGAGDDARRQRRGEPEALLLVELWILETNPRRRASEASSSAPAVALATSSWAPAGWSMAWRPPMVVRRSRVRSWRVRPRIVQELYRAAGEQGQDIAIDLGPRSVGRLVDDMVPLEGRRRPVATVAIADHDSHPVPLQDLGELLGNALRIERRAGLT
jgi:hypothetical protein